MGQTIADVTGMLAGLLEVSTPVPQGSKVTQLIHVDCPKRTGHLEKRTDTLGECPLSSRAASMGPHPHWALAKPRDWRQTAQFHFAPEWQQRLGRSPEEKDEIETLKFGFVSTSARKQVSLLALDSLPISHEITSFSPLPSGPWRPHTKVAEGTLGPRE